MHMTWVTLSVISSVRVCCSLNIDSSSDNPTMFDKTPYKRGSSGRRQAKACLDAIEKALKKLEEVSGDQVSQRKGYRS